MKALTIVLAALSLSACASTGSWRELRIDGSSESAFNESVSALNAELPYARNQMFSLALVDIARTEIAAAERAAVAGTEVAADEAYRRQLDGLGYDGVIALADRSGPSISYLYSQRVGRAAARGAPAALPGTATPQTDASRFPVQIVVPPGMASMAQ